jgi:MarR family transcriptional regulator, organic hydroperoxide resistance regulator
LTINAICSSYQYNYYMNDDYSPAKDSLGFIIYRTALALKSALQRFFKENGYEITAEQWAVLRHLWDEDGLSQREIAEKTSKDKPNITRMVDALEQKRLVFRQPDPRDRRKYCIYLTKEGKQLQERLWPLAQDLRQRVTQSLTPSEIDLLKDSLNKIYQDICRL